MSTGTLIGLLLGAGFAAGVVIVVAGSRGWSIADRFRSEGPSLTLSRDMQLRIAGGVVAGFVVLLLTRWIVAGVGAAAIIIVWPYLFGSAGEGRRDLANLDGLATWTESLRDTIAGAIGLEQAIPATTSNAPAVLATSVGAGLAHAAASAPAPDWTDCQDGFQCAKLPVPLDYDHPEGEQIQLAMIRLPAADP